MKNLVDLAAEIRFHKNTAASLRERSRMSLEEAEQLDQQVVALQKEFSDLRTAEASAPAAAAEAPAPAPETPVEVAATAGESAP